jgi:hypothetical protein
MGSIRVQKSEKAVKASWKPPELDQLLLELDQLLLELAQKSN